MRHSLYWDDFNKRAIETAHFINENALDYIPVRRVSVFITNRCNFKCEYCKHPINKEQLDKNAFETILKLYGNTAIIHITGGEPSLVDWLYPTIEKYGNIFKFHLNTNAFIKPPSKFIKRLKVSLDSCDKIYWNKLVHVDAFNTVVNNIKEASKDTVTSITYTMTKDNYERIPEFIKFCNFEFPNLYAIFFSIFKGTNPKFVFTDKDVDNFFNNIKPKMDLLLKEESKNLLNETITEKFRVMQGIRFPENTCKICYLSLSERVFLPSGEVYGCSHLIRDGIKNPLGKKHEKCLYGCNRRLVEFNNEVEKLLKNP